MSDIEQPILIMTGMHRSGTSLTSSLLASAGLDIGKNLVGANDGNPKGHFENIEVVNFHETVLYSLGIDKIGWTKQYKLTPSPYFFEQAHKLIEENKSLTQPWGWKEPRTTLFLDFWANILPKANFLFVFRRPWEVIDSLYRRGDDIFHTNPKFALEVWMSYNQALLDFYHEHSDRCLIFNLNQIINTPNQLISEIKEKLGISLNQVEIELYDKKLLSQDTSESSYRPWIIKNYFPASLEIYHQLNQITNYEDPVIAQLTEIPNIDLWILNDWLKVHLLGRQLKYEYSNIQKISQELAEKKQLEQNLKESHQQQQELNVEKKQLEEDLKESHQQQQELNAEKKQLEEDLKESRQQQEELNVDLEELHYYNSELTVKNKELNRNLEQLKEKYSESEANLAESQQELAESKADLEQLRFQINQINCLLEEYDISTQENHHKYSQLNDYVKKLEQESMENKLELERILTKERSHLEQAQQKIEAMETSKFWQLRKQWFKLKKTVGLGYDE